MYCIYIRASSEHISREAQQVFARRKVQYAAGVLRDVDVENEVHEQGVQPWTRARQSTACLLQIDMCGYPNEDGVWQGEKLAIVPKPCQIVGFQDSKTLVDLAKTPGAPRSRAGRRLSMRRFVG